MAPRVNKATQEALDTHGFEFAEVPERDVSRTSRYDEMWAAAIAVCVANPGRTLKARTYNNTSGASQDATKINNNEHRVFAAAKANGEYDGNFVAVSGPAGEDETYQDKDDKTRRCSAVYLRYEAAE
jgi:hypothetical protein